jgi:hypothetical protein
MSGEKTRFYEQADLSENNHSIPRWLLLLWAGIAVVFVYYLSRYLY